MKKTPPAGFNPAVPLPKDLTIGHIARAIQSEENRHRQEINGHRVTYTTPYFRLAYSISLGMADFASS